MKDNIWDSEFFNMGKDSNKPKEEKGEVLSLNKINREFGDEISEVIRKYFNRLHPIELIGSLEMIKQATAFVYMQKATGQFDEKISKIIEEVEKKLKEDKS